MKSVLITSSILILLIAALRPLLRGKIDPRAQYALWLIVALRLLVPVNLVESAYSALALLERTEEPRQIVKAIGQTAIPAQSYDDAHAQIVEEYRQQGVDTAALTPRDLMDIDAQARERMQGPTLAELAAKYARPLWLGGAGLTAVWFLLVNARLRRKLGRAELLEIEEACGLPVFVSAALPSPCLSGFLRPAVFLTPSAAEDPDRLRHVLAHETTHYRHRDHWWSLVRCLCLCLYWFDPLVWWAAAMSRQDCELACDAGAIRRLGEAERLSYGRTLVAMIASGRNSLLQTATTMAGGKRRVRERVSLIARKPKTVIALALALVLVLALAVGWTFTSAPERPALTADTLVERLEDIPEDLQGNVKTGPSTQSLYSSALTAYWMERPWTDYEAGWGWLLTVYRWDQEEFDANYQPGALSCFARDGDGFYYVILRASDVRCPASEEMVAEIPGATEVEYHYGEAFEAVWDYVEQTVLATEGVEPCMLPDTLRDRLNSVPMELQQDVMTGPGHDDDPILVRYWMNRDWTSQLNPGYDNGGLGYLLHVEELSQEEFEEHIGRDNSGWECIAKRGDTYYAVVFPTDVRFYSPDDADDYHSAYDAIRAYAEQMILGTEGMEPVDPLSYRMRVPADTLQARLLELPEELQDNVEARPDEGTLAVYYFKHPGEPVDESQYLLLVLERTEENLEAYRAASYHSGGIHWFAKRGSTYYVFNWNTSIEYAMEDEEQFTAAFRAVQDFARSTVLATEGAEPFDLNSASLTPAQQEVQEAIDAIAAAPSVQLALSLNLDGRNVGYIYQTTPDDYCTRRLNSLVTGYQWEPLTGSVPEEVLEAMQTGGGLNISVPNSGPTLILHETANIVSVTPGPDGPSNLYQIQPLDENEPSDSYLFYPQSAYQRMRYWFDEVQLNALRVPVASIPDRGQSHQEIVEEWIEGFEGAMTKCAPGGTYTCTYLQPTDIRVDFHGSLSETELNDFAQARGYIADDYGKTWFTFIYRLIFVPENELAKHQLLAGNTEDYTGAGAPEGAQICSRVAYMRLVDGQWVTDGGGTGW